MKVAPLNRLQYFRNLGIGINFLVIYFIMWNFWKSDRKEKGKRGTVQLGQKGHNAAGPDGFQPTRVPRRRGKGKIRLQLTQRTGTRGVRLNLTGGSHPSGREADGQGPWPS